MQVSDGGILASLGGMGALIGLGQLLLSEEKITLRKAAGRAIVTAGISTAAAAVLTYFPQLPFPALVGVAALIASLGTTGLERLVARVLPATRAE